MALFVIQSSKSGPNCCQMFTCGCLLGDSLDSLEELGILLVDEVGQVASVIEDHVEGLAVGEHNGLCHINRFDTMPRFSKIVYCLFNNCDSDQHER